MTTSRATARSTAWLLGALTLGIAAVVLWLVLRTIQSERLASREQWREAAQLRLNSAVTRMRESWLQREAAIRQLSDLPSEELFAYIVRDHLADTAICGSGASSYPSLDEGKHSANTEAQQKLVALRDLISKGDHDAALALSSGYFKEHRSGTTAEGRNIAAAADLMLMNALAEPKKDVPPWLSDRLIEQLKTYAANSLPSAQRRFLMEQVARLRQRHPTDLFPSYVAEVQAQAFLSKGAAADSVVVRLRDVVLLISSETLGRTAEDKAVRLVRSGDNDGDVETLTARVSPQLGEWRAALSLNEHVGAVNTGGTFGLALGGGIATLVLALLTALTWRNVQQQLKRAQLQEELTATVSHELRTPLSSMRVLVESLLEEDAPDALKTREYLELIARENSRLSRMIDNFLTLARLERGKQSPQGIRVSEIITRVKQAADDAGHGARLLIKADLPDVEVHVDPAALEVALLNLIDNACKYSPPDCAVELAVLHQNQRVQFAVCDHGPGLTAVELERIWLPFERLNPSTQHGCGLGLAIVRRIASQAYGSVEASSTPGEGTIFNLSIPIA